MNGKDYGGRHGKLGLYNVKSMSAGSGKSKVSGVNSRRVEKKKGKITIINLGELESGGGGGWSRGFKRHIW